MYFTFQETLKTRNGNEWSGSEAGTDIKVQVSLGCIYKRRKARQRTVYPNWQGKSNNLKLHYSVAVNRELSYKAKLSIFCIFKTVFAPILIYCMVMKIWVITKIVQSQVQASKIKFP